MLVAKKDPLHAWRNVAILIGVASGFTISFYMLQQVVGIASPWLGLLAMFYFLGLIKVAEPLFLLTMPTALRRLRQWETDGSIYRHFLVPEFGKLLRGTPLRYLNNAVYLNQRQLDFQKILRLIEAAETAHFWAALLFTPYIGYLWLSGQFRIALLFLLIQLLFNIYPIMHLRMVRDRLHRHLQDRLSDSRLRVNHSAHTRTPHR